MSYVRGLGFHAFLAISTLLLSVCLAPTALFGRSGARAVAKVWCAVTLASLRAIAGVRTQVEGRENIPTGAAIVAANHQSMWETLFLFKALPAPAFVVKKELLSIPIFGFWLRRTGAIALDRSAGPRALKELTAAAVERLSEGAQLVIFPEGTRTPPGTRSKLNPGVAAVYSDAGARCVPFAHDSGRRWLHPEPRKIPGAITARFLPPIPPGLQRREFIARLDAAIAEARPDLPSSQEAVAKPTPSTASAAASAGIDSRS